MSALSILLVALGACALARLLHPSFPRNDKSGSGLRHYPHTIPFLGLDLLIRIWMDFYRGQYSEGTRRRHISFGRTFSARNLRMDYIYTIEPQNILTITKHRSSSFEKSEWASEAAKHIGNGILLNEGEAWSRSRTMLKPIFSSRVTDDHTIIEPHISRLIKQMKFLIETEGTFEFQRLADMFMLDVVTEFLFGKSTYCLEFPRSPEGEEGVKFLMLVRSFDGPSASVMALGQPAKISLLFSKPQLNETVAGMKAFFSRKLADIMSSTEDSSSRNTPWSVFRMMKAGGIPDEQVQAELQNIFFASWDTTSALLANTVYALLRHQHVQRRLRDEIRAFHGIPPKKLDLNRIEYLRLVINETLRLYSPVTSHSRRAKIDTILPRGGGQDGQTPIIVRAGTTIMWSTYSLNRDPRWYGQDWAEFRPERWANLISSGATLSMAAAAADNGTDTGTGTDERQIGGSEASRAFFMPFGSGRRRCLGQQIARGEVMYAIVRILQEFPLLETREDEAERIPFKEAKAVSFCNADGVWVSVNRDRHRKLEGGS